MRYRIDKYERRIEFEIKLSRYLSAYIYYTRLTFIS